MTCDRPIIIIGAGGQARMLLEIARLHHWQVSGIAAPTKPESTSMQDIPWLGGDEKVYQQDTTAVYLLNAIGSVGNTLLRRNVFEQYKARGFRFITAIHTSAYVSTYDVVLGEGTQIMPGAIVNTNTRVGDNVLINSAAIVEHDCQVGDHSHIASGAIVCGGCLIGQGVHIGAGATINQGIHIGDGSVIASGSVVITDVTPHSLMAGVPATLKRAQAV